MTTGTGFFRVREDVVFGISINGTNFPPHAGGFRRLVIASSQDTFIPTMEVTLFDTHQIFSRHITLADGLPIQIQIGSNETNLSTLNFRLFKFNQYIDGGVSTYHLRGYSNHPKWFIECINRPLTMTSHDAVKELAARSNMNFEGHVTSDKMTWIPKNERICVFANRIARHGFGGNNSFMRLAVDVGAEKGLVRYLDINKYDAKKPGRVLFTSTEPTPDSNACQVLDHRNIMRSGFSNTNSGGYQSKTVRQSVFDDKSTQVISQMDVRRMSDSLTINSDIKKTIDNSRVEFRPIDCGNVHEAYDAALYRGKRNAAVFANGIDLLVSQRTGLRLLDPINFKSYSAPGLGPTAENRQTSGFYIVTAKSILLEVGNYFERIQAYSTGMNADYSGNSKQT